jgi:hypothetical protein
MTTASGFLHQFQIAGGTEFTPEVAGIAGIDVDHIRRPQGQSVFQFHPVVDINSGDLFGFHGVSSFLSVDSIILGFLKKSRKSSNKSIRSNRFLLGIPMNPVIDTPPGKNYHNNKKLVCNPIRSQDRRQK